MKWLLRSMVAATVIIGFALAVGYLEAAFGLLLLGVWFTVAWLGLERRPVSVDE